ncbi:MAG: hypothetical protein ACRDYZ_06360 [Acidimicrobiales bacterium]
MHGDHDVLGDLHVLHDVPPELGEREIVTVGGLPAEGRPCSFAASLPWSLPSAAPCR